MVKFGCESVMPDPKLRKLVNELSFSVANLNYRLVEYGKHVECRTMLRTSHPENIRHLSEILVSTPVVLELRISPTGD